MSIENSTAKLLNFIENNLLDLINNMNKKERKKFLKLYNKICDLEPSYKNKLLNEMYLYLSHAYNKVAKQRNKDKCEKEGHTFSEWKFSLQTVTTIMGDLGYGKEVEIQKEFWERKCTRCGYNEVVSKEPDEVRAVRLEQERQDKIKILRKELAELENK